MLSVLISIVIGLATGGGLFFADVLGWGWSLFTGLLGFGVSQFVMGRILQKRVKAAMESVQVVLAEGQKKLQAKTARWQLRPPGSLQAAQQEIARDQKEIGRASCRERV